jgi:isocitrate lyase
MTDPTFETLVPKAPEGRFNGIKRAYTPADVAKLRGCFNLPYPGGNGR